MRGLGGVEHALGPSACTPAPPAARRFALKTIYLSRVGPELLQQMRDEIQFLATMDHPFIVKARADADPDPPRAAPRADRISSVGGCPNAHALPLPLAAV